MSRNKSIYESDSKWINSKYLLFYRAPRSDFLVCLYKLSSWCALGILDVQKLRLLLILYCHRGCICTKHVSPWWSSPALRRQMLFTSTATCNQLDVAKHHQLWASSDLITILRTASHSRDKPRNSFRPPWSPYTEDKTFLEVSEKAADFNEEEFGSSTSVHVIQGNLRTVL